MSDEPVPSTLPKSDEPDPPKCDWCQQTMHLWSRNASSLSYGCMCQGVVTYKNIHKGDRTRGNSKA